MIFFEILRVAMDAIRANKLRSFLTMLGIVIGVGAVITMVALGEGAQQQVENQIESLGTNVLTVRPGQGMFRGVRGGSNARLTTEDVEAVQRGAPALLGVAPEMQGQLQVQFGRNNASVRILGTTPNYVEVENHTLELGRFFDESENRGRRRVAVLGGAVPAVLNSETAELVGRTISIRNISFEVVGVLEEKGGSGWFNQDEQIFVPLETAQFRLLGTDRVSQFKVVVESEAAIPVAMVQIEEVLRREHRLPLGRENDFWISDSVQFLEMAQETTQTFTMLLAGIAAVSLLVGGIGIMNIMLVSVTERTKEIGVRKALGATRSAILLQFLLEATTLCMTGGILGVAFAYGAAEMLSRSAGWTMAIAPQAIGLAVVFAAAVGMFFGLWPARRAARLDPIVALRYE
ncbi:MAG: ABC transporter permease [Gemmatimonadota bacterium]|uniref:ABC transporter permease n=1 Tax=Candidatus Palauibacter soopunensis TaxID=3056739 RepID=UPI0023856054|nr:ABC transporter permease [Candidatus Palauibacter soopunensis]MDE2878004.1 ABC transporter permease [Candidatus Palauibacter soopunensis]MDE2943620.1 ABC transporter permease [Gemmatimonadota bacterium]